MRFITTIYLTLLFALATSRSVPRTELSIRNPAAAPNAHGEFLQSGGLEKRRGGGGGGHGGGSGGGSGGKTGSGGSSSGSSGSSGGKTGSGSSSGGTSKSGSTSPSSNVGGATHSGSGTSRGYGGGSYYAGGSRTPYPAGASTPGGIRPSHIVAIAALAFWVGTWSHPAYPYYYPHPYIYHNPSQSSHSQNETLKVVCLCEEYAECGCDDQSSNATYIDALLKANPPNNSVVCIARVNNTETLFINGTLANGTTAPDASISGATRATQWSGYLVTVALVTGMVWTL